MSVKREAQSNNVIELSFIGCLIARRNSTCPSKRARATCWSLSLSRAKSAISQTHPPQLQVRRA